MKHKLARTLRFALLMLSVWLILPVYGTTIARIGSQQLVDKAELIFEGVVVSARSEMNYRGYIYTYVEFIVDDVLAGDVAIGATLTLRFTGGTVDDTRMDVGARIPKLGERGVYFVEQVSPGLVNPLLGWAQGHFIVNDDGSVVAGNGQAVHDVKRKSSNGLREFSVGVASGIDTSPESKGSSVQNLSSILDKQPMSVDGFKRKIMELKH